jgi:hypothetical protein
MPTDRERNGDFSQTFDANGKLIVIKDPLTGQPFPGNVIPQDRIDPAIRNILSRNPWKAPNDPGTLTPSGPINNLVVPTKGRYYITRWDGKIDHQFSPANKVFGRYSQNRVRAPGRYSNELLWALPDPVYVSPVGCRRNVDARRLGRAILNVG